MSKQSDLVSVSQGASGDPLFIDTANDRVGVGTSSPNSKAQVNYVVPASVPSAGAGGHGFAVGSAGYGIAAGALTSGNGYLQATRWDGSATNYDLILQPNGGNVLVGTTSSSTKWTATNGVDMGIEVRPANFGFVMHMPNEAMLINIDNVTAFQRFYYRGTAVGAIATNGSSTFYNTSSDYRLKENVTSLTGAADRLAQIPVHRFNFIADPDRTVDGFLAHEVQDIVPECVTGTKDQVDDEGNPVYQGIDQSKLVPLLTAALQEALSEIQDLKARVATLEGGAA